MKGYSGSSYGETITETNLTIVDNCGAKGWSSEAETVPHLPNTRAAFLGKREGRGKGIYTPRTHHLEAGLF